jgi:hypothetical protein
MNRFVRYRLIENLTFEVVQQCNEDEASRRKRVEAAISRLGNTFTRSKPSAKSSRYFILHLNLELHKMAPSPLQQRRTHNTLLFQKLLNLREGASPFTLILDTLEQSGAPVVREFARRAKV